MESPREGGGITFFVITNEGEGGTESVHMFLSMRVTKRATY